MASSFSLNGPVEEDVSMKHLIPKMDIEAEKSKHVQLGCLKLHRTALNIVLTLCNVFSMVLMTVSLPLFAGDMVNHGSDPFTVLSFSAFWFSFVFFFILFVSKLYCQHKLKLKPQAGYFQVFIVGFLNSLNGLLVVYASDPDRTPPYLQAVLTTTSIPYTVGFRYLILRKGVGVRRLACTAAVLIGLFISLEPQIWDFEGSGTSKAATESTAYRVLWPVAFACGFIPLGLLNVLVERDLKKKDTESLVYISWVQLFQFLVILCLFWTDFIPAFGMSESPSAFWEQYKTGMSCLFGSGNGCGVTILKAVLFITGYCLSNMFMFLLLKYSDSAIYAVLVQALATPLSAIFWTFFNDDPFSWAPKFTLTTAFTLAGLAVIVPAIALYNYYRSQEETDDVENEQENTVDIN